MNITPSLIYWITRLDGIRDVAIICTIILFFVAFGSGLMYLCINTEEDTSYSKKSLRLLSMLKLQFKVSLSGLIVSVILSVFVPSTKEAAAMIVVPKIAHSETIRELGSDLGELAKEWIKELKPSRSKKTDDLSEQAERGADGFGSTGV